MKYLIISILAVALMWLLLIPVAIQLKNRTQVINCQLAEISPDFTPEMREQCRELRRGS